MVKQALRVFRIVKDKAEKSEKNFFLELFTTT